MSKHTPFESCLRKHATYIPVFWTLNVTEDVEDRKWGTWSSCECLSVINFYKYTYLSLEPIWENICHIEGLFILFKCNIWMRAIVQNCALKICMWGWLSIKCNKKVHLIIMMMIMLWHILEVNYTQCPVCKFSFPRTVMESSHPELISSSFWRFISSG